jgi:hypothetical protein
MDAKEVIAVVRSAVQKVHGDQISPKDLLRFLNDVEQNANSSLERSGQLHEFQLAQYQADVQSDLEMFKSVMDSGKEALNALILIGGGAAVALLSFLGNKAEPVLGRGLTLPLKLFGAAVLIGALCHGFRYLNQVAYTFEWMRVGTGLNVLTVLFVLVKFFRTHR